MSVVLGSSRFALISQRSFFALDKTVRTSYERLSSGQRINRASDDAAGLSVATDLGVSSRLHTTAVRNLNDALSALSIVDSTLDNQASIVIRLQELAQQSANGTLSDTQRSSISAEYRALLQEFGRLGDSAKFNGINLLQGDENGISSLLFQAGIDGSARSRLSFATQHTGSLSGNLNASDLDGSGGFDANDLFIADVAYNSGNSTQSLMDIFLNRMYRFTSTIDSGVHSGRQLELALAFVGNDGFGGSTYYLFAKGLSSDNWTGVQSADVNFNQSTHDSDNKSITFNGLDVSAALQASGTINGSVDLQGLSFFDIPQTRTESAIDFTGAETKNRALFALGVLENRLNQINEIRGEFGAAQYRIETAISVSLASAEGTKSAESQIRDADIASESAQLIAGQIRQQTAASLQAVSENQSRLALDLLQF